jgi:MFS transporter, DHA3 family, macrolide efflux protein
MTENAERGATDHARNCAAPAAAAAEPGLKSSSMFALLSGNRDLRMLWWGQLLSRFGSSVSYVALLLLVRKITGSNLATALVGISEALPGIIAGPIAGTLVDRHDRKKIMIAADILRAFAMGFVVLLVISGRIEAWHLYILAALGSIGTAFFDPAQMAIIPSLAREEEMDRANALLKTTYQIGGLVGPAIGAILYTSFGPASCFAIDAVSFFISAVFILKMSARSSATVEGAREPVLQEIRNGFALMAKEPVIAGILISCVIVNFAFFPLPILLPEIADKAYAASRLAFASTATSLGLASTSPLLARLGSPEFFFGALMTCLMFGQIIASLTIGFFEKVRGVRHFIHASLFLIALSISSIGFLPHAFVGLAAVFVIGYSSTVTEIRLTSFIQRSFPPEMLGRIFASILTIAFAMTPISMTTCGILADHYGAAFVLARLGLALFAAAAILFASRLLQAELRLEKKLE